MAETRYFDVVIIGGGAAGLMCAYTLVTGGAKKPTVMIAEARDRVAKKLLVTGNGKCNLSNSEVSKEHYSNSAFTAEVLLTNNEIQRVFNDMGLPTVCRGMLWYPHSEQASGVVDTLRTELALRGVQTVTNTRITAISASRGEYILLSENAEYRCKYVVFAIGSNASGGIDSTALLRNLGVECTPFSPTLVPIQCATTGIRGMNGIRAKVRATLSHGGKELCVKSGEILFKDYGISGILALELSRFITAPFDSYKITLDFLDSIDENQITEILGKRLCEGYRTDELHAGIVHKQVLQNALSLVVGQGKPTAKELVNVLKAYPLTVTGLLPTDMAQVMRGGIRTEELTADMQLRRLPHAYAVGETVDVDGETGGFNLAFAWSTGIRAAKHILLSL